MGTFGKVQTTEENKHFSAAGSPLRIVSARPSFCYAERSSCRSIRGSTHRERPLTDDTVAAHSLSLSLILRKIDRLILPPLPLSSPQPQPPSFLLRSTEDLETSYQQNRPEWSDFSFCALGPPLTFIRRSPFFAGGGLDRNCFVRSGEGWLTNKLFRLLLLQMLVKNRLLSLPYLFLGILFWDWNRKTTCSWVVERVGEGGGESIERRWKNIS
ncbi:hypothetical protein CEXT_506881 [Caerostris extrusa]|uniref:Uncharacterized protein n=1 Tax=Caerostris extrusa TaxID=172846 RepID=A0AAV4TLH5_CAEEX|nr:hypothetical protein CEXT_506881 [Caerostris extrusa]